MASSMPISLLREPGFIKSSKVIIIARARTQRAVLASVDTTPSNIPYTAKEASTITSYGTKRTPKPQVAELAAGFLRDVFIYFYY